MQIVKIIKQFWHYLTVAREYKQVDGIAYIKERGKNWESLLEHLEKEHPGAYQQLEDIDES